MITPFLEQLILTGKAQQKHFTAGSQKCVIEVPKDHFIIIHAFTYFPFIPPKTSAPTLAEIEREMITQMRIFSDKGYSNFIIRNQVTFGVTLQELAIQPVFSLGQPYQENTYLIHEQDVSITFSKGLQPPVGIVSAIAPTTTIARPVPVDYGKVGYGGSIQVGTVKQVAVGVAYRPLGKNTPQPAGFNYVYNTLEYPVNNTTRYQNAELQIGTGSFPIVNIQYLEVKGRPTNIAPTN